MNNWWALRVAGLPDPVIVGCELNKFAILLTLLHCEAVFPNKFVNITDLPYCGLTLFASNARCCGVSMTRHLHCIQHTYNMTSIIT